MTRNRFPSKTLYEQVLLYSPLWNIVIEM